VMSSLFSTWWHPWPLAAHPVIGPQQADA
jgi:hypothetical protein